MSPRKYCLHNGRGGVALAVRVTPRASRNEVVEIMPDGTIRIRLTSNPVEEEINKSLTIFLSKILGVPKSNIDIIAGQTGRDKLLSVLDMGADMVNQKIREHLV